MKKLFKWFKTRLGLSLLVNLVLAIILGYFLGIYGGLCFIIGAGIGALESLLQIEFVEVSKIKK